MWQRNRGRRMTREELLRYGKEYLHDLETACCKIGELHLNFVRESIKALEQEPKRGHWINKSRRSASGISFVASECSCCGKKTLFNCDEFLYRYCPNCGAKMESEET